MLSQAQVKKFQDIYLKRFGKEISEEDACELGAKLINLVKVVYRPPTEREYAKLHKA